MVLQIIKKSPENLMNGFGFCRKVYKIADYSKYLRYLMTYNLYTTGVATADLGCIETTVFWGSVLSESAIYNRIGNC